MKPRLLIATLIAAGFLLAYNAINPLRAEHLAALGLFFPMVASSKTRRLGVTLLPVLLFALVYDLLRVFADRANEIVSVTTVPRWEDAIFAFESGGKIVDPNALLVQLQAIPIDLFGAVLYATHLAGIFLLGGYLFWRTTRPDSASETERRLHRFMWGFLAVNILANLTQVLWPVAPPWYLDTYGAVAPSGAVSGDPAGLARVDAWLGIDYFGGIYRQGSYVFGAMPSLHVAFPAWFALNLRRWWSRLGGWTYVGLMSFYAVYFNHHFVLDVVAGIGLALFVYVILEYTAARALPTAIHRWVETLFEGGDLEPSAAAIEDRHA